MLKKLGIIAAAIAVVVVLVAAMLLYLIGSSMGPAFPERDGAEHLQRQGYSQAVIDGVIDLQDLGAPKFVQLAKEDSTNVRFLIAQNPFISPALLQQLVEDESDFVRGGAALNPHLTSEQIRRLSTDPSHTTQAYLARNPNVPAEDLVRLHQEQGIDLVWFAMNPACPQVLQDKMRATNDEDALYWLDLNLKAPTAEPK